MNTAKSDFGIIQTIHLNGLYGRQESRKRNSMIQGFFCFPAFLRGTVLVQWH